MGRKQQHQEEFETVDELTDEEAVDENLEPPTPAKPPAPLVSNHRRNLTYERIRATLEGDKATALKGIGEDDTVEVSLPKLDADGEKVRDSSGYVVIETRKVLKRDHVALAWDKKIEKVCGKLERNV